MKSEMAAVSENCIMEQRLNPLTGQSEWIVVKLQSESEVDKYDDFGALNERGGSLGHTLYLDMLNDVERNSAYDQAIRKVVAEGAHHVLDIGYVTANILSPSVVLLHRKGLLACTIVCLFHLLPRNCVFLNLMTLAELEQGFCL